MAIAVEVFLLGFAPVSFAVAVHAGCVDELGDAGFESAVVCLGSFQIALNCGLSFLSLRNVEVSCSERLPVGFKAVLASDVLDVQRRQIACRCAKRSPELFELLLDVMLAVFDAFICDLLLKCFVSCKRQVDLVFVLVVGIVCWNCAEASLACVQARHAVFQGLHLRLQLP